MRKQKHNIKNLHIDSATPMARTTKNLIDDDKERTTTTDTEIGKLRKLSVNRNLKDQREKSKPNCNAQSRNYTLISKVYENQEAIIKGQYKYEPNQYAAQATGPECIFQNENSISFNITVSPAAKLCPSIISASSSAVFSSVSAHPRPALKRGLSSIFLTAASTASTALPPCVG